MSTAAIVILVVVLLAVLFAAGWFLGGQARSRRLRNRFGPEYDHRLETAENRRVAERELAEREKRHAKLSLRPLADTARAHYVEQWTRVQERFVDAPREAVAGAEDLVHTVMRERGYPMEGFDQQAADLSVEHAGVVDGYRSAHEIRGRDGQADTEELRTALVHYREIFRELVGPADAVPEQRAPEIDHHRQDREAHHA
ncbi:hypothetical protein [Actinophytocola algeriensis]|uniref:Secreted protein n=1 Tax=Actinophytocola algeriensis TaxID=1768010 RepID=A0A7W7Q9P1_9PSEU|nr:hypothetical protein [Actinophytocola algeriensis]MBB4909564.1 hypothetical protein [Actinophytocola algeriensis]MBE1475554.1 hypothetical protein [Actinophytocola algeriensis]